MIAIISCEKLPGLVDKLRKAVESYDKGFLHYSQDDIAQAIDKMKSVVPAKDFNITVSRLNKAGSSGGVKVDTRNLYDENAHIGMVMIQEQAFGLSLVDSKAVEAPKHLKELLAHLDNAQYFKADYVHLNASDMAKLREFV